MADEETSAEETEETATTEEVEETTEEKDVDWKQFSRKNEKAAKQARKEAEELRKENQAFKDRDKSEQEKLEDRSKAAEARAAKAENELMRMRVASKENLPADLADRLRGETEEELEADAKRLSELVATSARPAVDIDAGKGKSVSDSSGPAELASRVSRSW